MKSKERKQFIKIYKEIYYKENKTLNQIKWLRLNSKEFNELKNKLK